MVGVLMLTSVTACAALSLDGLDILNKLSPPPASLSTATVRTNFEPQSISGDVRLAGNCIEGVHIGESSPLAERVIAAVPELSSWDKWYKHPPYCDNGHLHTILAAKLRSTRPVKYHRQLVPTPDGGTLAIDLLAGIRSYEQTAASSLLTGGALPGAAEDDGFVTFVSEPPPLTPDRPMLVLASGLGGGSQDTYVRSMAASAAERGWQVAVLNMRACGAAPVTSPQLFSAYRGANDDMRTAVRHLRSTRLGGAGKVAAIGWSNSGTIVNNVLAEQVCDLRPIFDRLNPSLTVSTLL